MAAEGDRADYVAVNVDNNPRRLSSSESTGECEPRSFEWRDIRCSYTKPRAASRGSGGNGKDGSMEVEVLHGVSGSISQGSMLAILGPSGSGKSCLVDILAARKSVGKVHGQRLLDGKRAKTNVFKRHTSYVPQEDVFHPTSTVKEAVLFQAHLRLSRKMAPDRKEDLAMQLIEDVGLKGKENQSVGGPLPGGLQVRGLSGGEQRRLSLCCACITKPSILFLDEATSGLDGFAALVVMRLLKKFCGRGMMVILTIHQPRTAIWSLFEKVMILSSGYQLFFGGADQAEAWFCDKLGYPRRTDTSTGDFILDLVNVSFVKDPEIFGEVTMHTQADVAAAAAKYKEAHGADLHISVLEGGSLSSAHSTELDADWNLVEGLLQWLWQFRVLLRRNSRNYLRNPGNVLARVLVMALVSALQGLVYYQIGKTESKSYNVLSAMTIMGSLFYTLFAVTILPFASLGLMIYDRQFFAGEAASKLYTPSAYYMANMTLETLLSCFNGTMVAVIAYCLMDYASYTNPVSAPRNFLVYLTVILIQTNLGNMIVQFAALLAPNQDIAFAIAAGYDSVTILASGYIVRFTNFSHYSKWLQWLAHTKYSYQALTMNALKGTPVEAIIQFMELNTPHTVAQNIGCSLTIYIGLFIGGFCCLRFLHKERR